MTTVDVPVCAGRGSQAACRHYQYKAELHHCTALYNVVTGEPVRELCESVRGDQLLCGRHGALYEPVVVATYTWVRERDGLTLRKSKAREDLG